MPQPRKDSLLSLDRIREAYDRIPAVFRDSPQVAVHESRVTKVKSISGLELTPWMLRSIAPKRAAPI